MNDWIDGKGDPRPPQSKLPVLPPPIPAVDGKKRQPAVAPASQRQSPKSLPAAEGIPFAKPIPMPATEVADPDAVTAGTSYDTVVFDPLTGFSPNDIPLGFSPLDPYSGRDLEFDKDENTSGIFTTHSLLRGVPSWLASFVFHLVLILALALLTIATEQGANIEFVLSDQPLAQELDFMEVAIEIDSVTAEDDKEKLQTNSQEIISELFVVDSNLEDINDDLADRLEAVDALSPSRLQFERGDGKGASFFGSGALGSKFVFVVDCSGSMEDEYRWIMARRELKEAILGLTPKQDFYVFLYNDKSFSYTRREAKLIPATEKNKAKIFKWLDKQQPIGDTRPWKAMRLSLRMKPDAIFLLSDGELKDDTVPRLRRENKEKKIANEKIGKIPVHTVSLGSGIGSHTMRAIAEQNDGTFTHVNTW